MNKKTTALTTEQYTAIIETMKQGFTGCRPNERIATALVVEGNLGLRISDIITLRWCDIDLEKRKMVKTQVKTRSRNIIPLAEDALKILEKWKGKHKVFVFGLMPDNFDLADEEELRIRRNTITATANKSLQRLSEITQIDKKVTFHMARHSWAVNALEQGMEMSMISSLLGHSSSLVTEKVYAEFRQEVKAEAVAKLNFDF